MTTIFAKYGRRPGKKLNEPDDDVAIVDLTMGRYGVLAIFIKPDGRLSADVLDAFSECRADENRT